jgi:hypothetical protein
VQTKDLYQRIKQAVVNTIKAMNLPLIGANVFSQYDCDTLNSGYPKITCITAGLTEQVLPGDSLHREYEWPVGVMIEDDPGAKVHLLESQYTSIRKQITDTFHQANPCAAQGVPEAHGSMVEPRVIFDPRLTQYGAVRSSLLIRVGCREPRY